MKELKNIPVWNPISDSSFKEINEVFTKEMSRELNDMFNNGLMANEGPNRFVHFSWDDEDNEMFPHVANYYGRNF